MNEPEDNIERLKKKLYERGGENFTHERSELSPNYRNLKTTWEEEVLPPEWRSKKESSRFLVNLLIFSFVLFLVALGLAGYVFLRGKNLVSNDNIEVSIKGPTSVKAGDEINLQLQVANKNNEPIDPVDLIITYPDGTKSASSSGENLTRSEINLGKIASGQTINQSVRAVIFGQENTAKEIRFLFNYHVPGSNALFQKEQVYKFTVNASPLNVTFTIPPESNSNQVITLGIKAVSNSSSVLKNVLLKVTYPPGFLYKDASSQPLTGNNLWLLGDIAPGQEKTINISGVLAGQNEDMKAFQLVAGVQDQNNSTKISLVYNDILKTISIKRPFLGLTLQVNGENKEESVIKSGEKIRIVANWMNNLPSSIVDGEVAVLVNGETVDKFSFINEKGFYRSQDNMVVLNKSSDSGLAEIGAGTGGNLLFTFKTLPQLKDGGGAFTNSEITLTAKIKGLRTSEGFAGEDLSTEVTKKIKIQSDVKLSALANRNIGSFTNTGPLPPQVEKESTYTLTWSIINPANDIKETVVKATLPANVRWLNNISPNKENVTFDAKSNQVTWVPGYIKALVGVTGPARAVSFQVAVTPSTSQLETQASLIGGSTLTALDIFTQTTLTVSQPDLDTSLTGEENLITPNDGRVVR